MTPSAGRYVPLRWTRWYWPAALTLSVAALIIATYAGGVGQALIAGTVLLAGPEVWFLLHRQWASTLSDWFWRVLRVTASQPIRGWSFVHFAALGLYVAVAARVELFMWMLPHYWPGALSSVVAVWLLPHLFGGWWR